MKFESYASACIPTKTTILGLELQPLSLGHYLLMKRYGCRYASDEETTIDVSDLILGVLICSMTYENFNTFINDVNVTRYVMKWGKQVRRHLKKDKTFNIFNKFIEFKQYLDNGSVMPLFWYGDNMSDRHSGAHWSLSLQTVLISKLGFSQTEALNMPLTQAFSFYLKHAEIEGAVEIMKDNEEDLIKGTK